ncbi:MAG: hypothetical protein C5B47_02960 [Verrucomicrobia bacterium]|nr:MAG: hypothetical protein C5B47_02960 [Verrucomicrobiota bacterium]
MNRFHNFAGKVNVLILAPILTLVLFSSGCGLQRSTRYYWPTVAQTFPPKSKATRLPVLDHPPKQPYTVIGTMTFDSKTDEMNELYRILQYNGQRNGADAIIMKVGRSSDSDAETFSVKAQMIVFR